MTTDYPFITRQQEPTLRPSALVGLIADTQLPSGAIPWSIGDKTDPWDHVESAMGLTIGGRHDLARKAFEWLRQVQREDGSWFAAYKNGAVADRTRETNHAAYIAVGLYHYLLVTGDVDFIRHLWPTMEKAVDFALRLQTAGGEIHWALNPMGEADPMALLTGCSSIAFSLKCALALSRNLGLDRRRWNSALTRLEAAIRNKPHRFNMTKSRFSMDWFYPVLCGTVTGPQAKVRLESHWKKFVIQNVGVRCVSDQPWVTIAESSELVLALAAVGNDLLARIVFNWIGDQTFDDGTFWCGFTFPDMVIWPEEKITWTNAVVLMAA
ncbi:MAG: phenyltransferase domain-containing protein, partial [Desulfobacteraceae bacterium]